MKWLYKQSLVAFTAPRQKEKKDTDWTFRGKFNKLIQALPGQDRCSIWKINAKLATRSYSSALDVAGKICCALAETNRCQQVEVLNVLYNMSVMYSFWQQKKTLSVLKNVSSLHCMALKLFAANMEELYTQTPWWKNSWAHSPLTPHPSPLSNFYPLLPFHSGWNLTLCPRLPLPKSLTPPHGFKMNTLM